MSHNIFQDVLPFQLIPESFPISLPGNRDVTLHTIDPRLASVLFGRFPFRYVNAAIGSLIIGKEQTYIDNYVKDNPNLGFRSSNDFITVYLDRKEFDKYIQATSKTVFDIFDQVRSYRKFVRRQLSLDPNFNYDNYNPNQDRFRFGICFGHMMEIFIQDIINNFIKISKLETPHLASNWIANLYLGIDGFYGYNPYDITTSSELSSLKKQKFENRNVALLVPNTKYSSVTMQLFRRTLLDDRYVCKEEHKRHGVSINPPFYKNMIIESIEELCLNTRAVIPRKTPNESTKNILVELEMAIRRMEHRRMRGSKKRV